ncbi:hypothetical protein Aoki45_13810 [Algoriphagus sp. oki45]|nr:hypothetical protein Aoki45_13810 [Algoriphagus sp. oki45]
MKNRIFTPALLVFVVIIFFELTYSNLENSYNYLNLFDLNINGLIFSLLTIIFKFLQFIFITSILFLGAWMNHHKINFLDLFFIVLICDSIFCIPVAFEMFGISGLSKFDLSFSSYLNSDSNFKYLVVIFNLYEFVYWLLLTFVWSYYLNQRFDTIRIHPGNCVFM